jgi:hypothetical protein
MPSFLTPELVVIIITAIAAFVTAIASWIKAKATAVEAHAVRKDATEIIEDRLVTKQTRTEQYQVLQSRLDELYTERTVQRRINDRNADKLDNVTVLVAAVNSKVNGLIEEKAYQRQTNADIFNKLDEMNKNLLIAIKSKED